jgi:hypothetical protein
MVYLVNLLQPCSVFFPEIKQNNATHSTTANPNPWEKSTTANPKFFPETKHKHRKLRESPFLRFAT